MYLGEKNHLYSLACEIFFKLIHGSLGGSLQAKVLRKFLAVGQTEF